MLIVNYRQILLFALPIAIAACQPNTAAQNAGQNSVSPPHQPSVSAMPVKAAPVKPVIYQAFARLFGNQQSQFKAWGSASENGVGKFADFNDAALAGLTELGVTHLWLTGVPHHAMVADYQHIGVSLDDPDVVKGRAGSPYAVKDYYNVNPDLAIDPSKRLEEFQALLDRAHRHGLKVLIDIVPNHVARHYQSISKPAGARDFGQDDDVSVEYRRNNNFYYVPGKAFELPDVPADFAVLGGKPGGATQPLADGKFSEFPAKWTGNGARSAKPKFDDWYETVKINYGVKPDGSSDFPLLPADYAELDTAAHWQFWQDKSVPDSWLKFRDISHYWLAMGVDGFRYDMAEMVPVEFWSYLNSHIKQQNPQALLLAEVYQPQLYQDYLQRGKMDYLYDKVGFYDAMRALLQGQGTATAVLASQLPLQAFESHMLKFLENHDEQRIASPQFAGSAEPGKPAMAVSALIGRAPTLIYFGQEVGEAASEQAGFGQPSRTSIFDYIGVPAHQAWLNHGKFDGGGLTAQQQQLRHFYQKILLLSKNAPAFGGQFYDLHAANLKQPAYSEQQLSFARWSATQHIIVVANFSAEAADLQLLLPAELLAQWAAAPQAMQYADLLSGQTFQATMFNTAFSEMDTAADPAQAASAQKLWQSQQLSLPLAAYSVLVLELQPISSYD